MNVHMRWQSWIDQRLEGRSPRERRILVWGAAVSLLLILIVGCWMPLQQALSRMERSVSMERKRLAVMSAARLELASIENRARQPARPALSRPAIEELVRTRLAPSSLDIRLEGDQRVRVAFSGVQMTRVIEWIDELSRAQRVHVTFARLRPEGATISGEIQFSGPDQ